MHLTQVISKEYESLEEKKQILLKEIDTAFLSKVVDLWRRPHGPFPRIMPGGESMYLNRKFYSKVTNFFKINPGRLTPECISQLSVHIKEYQDKPFFDSLGFFLSYLINNHYYAHDHQQDTYFLFLENLKEGLNGIGFKNAANISVLGDVISAGEHMQNGTLFIDGNVKMSAGNYMKGGILEITGDNEFSIGTQMKGGTIILHGNAKVDVGDYMKNGNIVIYGNTELDIATEMKGGKITVHGEIRGGFGTDKKGGEIYHRTERIYPKETKKTKK